MSAELFIDTNVFIYQLDTSDPRKHQIAEQTVRSALNKRNACISWQVVQECMNVMLHKAAVKLPAAAARNYLDVVLLPLMQLSPSAAVYHRALDVQARWGFSLYDALIVASAMQAGCTTLLSEDLQHGQMLDGLRVVDPFR